MPTLRRSGFRPTNGCIHRISCWEDARTVVKLAFELWPVSAFGHYGNQKKSVIELTDYAQL